jgi:hypothetical protein
VDDKSKLLAFIQWRIANPDVGINDDVVESAIEKYMSEEVLSPTVDKEWNHICLTVGIPNGSRKKLEMQGISSLDSLMQVSCLKVRSCCLFLIALWFFAYLSLSLGQFRSKLESDTFEPQVWEEHLWKEVRTKLLSFLKWRQQNDDADIVQKFTDKAHEGMFKHQRIVSSYIKLALGQPFKEQNNDLFNIIEKENLLGDVIKECQQIIMASSKLREECGKFDYNAFIDLAIRCLHSLNRDPDIDGLEMIQKLVVIAGRTQSGKTAVKGVIQSMAGELIVSLVFLSVRCLISCIILATCRHVKATFDYTHKRCIGID